MDNLLITMDYSWLHFNPVVNELKVKENALIPLHKNIRKLDSMSPNVFLQFFVG